VPINFALIICLQCNQLQNLGPIHKESEDYPKFIISRRKLATYQKPAINNVILTHLINTMPKVRKSKNDILLSLTLITGKSPEPPNKTNY